MDQLKKGASTTKPWNPGKLLGQKALPKPQHTWAIRVHLQVANNIVSGLQQHFRFLTCHLSSDTPFDELRVLYRALAMDLSAADAMVNFPIYLGVGIGEEIQFSLFMHFGRGF